MTNVAKHEDADEIFRMVKVKLEAGERLSEEDFANLTLTPLMKSKMSRKDVIKKAIQTENRSLLN